VTSRCGGVVIFPERGRDRRKWTHTSSFITPPNDTSPNLSKNHSSYPHSQRYFIFWTCWAAGAIAWGNVFPSCSYMACGGAGRVDVGGGVRGVGYRKYQCYPVQSDDRPPPRPTRAPPPPPTEEHMNLVIVPIGVKHNEISFGNQSL